MPTISCDLTLKRAMRVGRALGLLASLLTLLLVSGATAQQGPAPVAGEPPIMAVEPPPVLNAPPPLPLPVPPAIGPGQPASPGIAALTQELLRLEGQTIALEKERATIRLKGMRIGKIISWTATAIFLTSAFSAFGSAEGIKEAIKDGRDDEIYDTNDDGEVNKDDEERSRRVARSLAISSLVPIGLGVWTSIVYRRRLNKQRDLGFQLEDVAMRRRSVLQRMSTELGVSAQHASLQLRLTF